MSATFGPAGNGDSFSGEGYRHTLDVPKYLVGKGLSHYEYQCGRGVKIGEDKAMQFGDLCQASGITLSLHAPYYISLSGVEEETRLRSIDYILQSARAAKAMGATRIVVHAGSCSKISREEALALASDTIKRAIVALDEENLSEVTICPETMGKINQLGTLDEVLALCALDERLIPCIDFGHLNARTFGGIAKKEDFQDILDRVETVLGVDRLRGFHSHFSKIEYTRNGGEKRHLTFSDTEFGPDFRPLMELVAKKGLSPTFVCESDGTQAEDAASMQAYYRSCL